VGPFQRWSSDAARTVTGVVAGAAGEWRQVWNIGTFPITLAAASGSSTAANQFTCPGAASIIVGPGERFDMIYSGTTSRWLVTKVRSDYAQGDTITTRFPGGASDKIIGMYHNGSAGYIFCQSGNFIFDSNTGSPLAQVDRGNGGLGVGPYSLAAAATVTGTADISLIRAAANVWKIASNSVGTGAGWLQNSAANSRASGDVTNATAVMAPITGISHTLVAGRKYAGRLVVFAKNSTAVEGVQFDFNGGAATMTSFAAGFVATPPIAGVVVGVAISAALNTALTVTTASTGYACYVIEFSMVVNAGGTFIPQFSEVTDGGATATVLLGSYCTIEDVP
jgi:hypothetical protein